MLARKRRSGMTLVEMVAAVAILLMIAAILAQVFYLAARAASRGKGLAQIYQVSRALEAAMSKDLVGATPDFFASGENGTRTTFLIGIPPGPYAEALSGAPFTAARMRRMLMGGSDYLSFTSASASGNYRGVAKVFYILRASGEFVRVTYADTSFTLMDYLIGAVEQGVDDLNNDTLLGTYEERRVMAENVQRVKISFLDRYTGPVSADAISYAYGVWLDDWDWNRKAYLPTAVKIELQIVDRRWVLADDDLISNRDFPTDETDDDFRACERFDADDGEAFRFIVNLPLGMKT
ncbi:MAG: type II secretion system protein [Planctomycetota bacterium]